MEATALALFGDATMWRDPLLDLGRGDHWNTPPEVLAPVLAMFGTIDCDPCTNARSIVPATLRYDGGACIRFRDLLGIARTAGPA